MRFGNNRTYLGVLSDVADAIIRMWVTGQVRSGGVLVVVNFHKLGIRSDTTSLKLDVVFMCLV